MSKIPQGIEMPNRKKQQGPVAVDLMRPGNGTPWEDRGRSGIIAAYFKTVFKSFTSPGLLVDHVGRPESTRDAASFAWICAAMWGVGILAWNAYWYQFVYPDPLLRYNPREFNPSSYWVMAFLQAAAVVTAVYLWLKLGARMYVALAGSELKGATPSLIFNCFAYSLGPSILALVPVWGPIKAPWPWVVAGVWIHFNLIVAGRRRLYLKGVSAIVNVMLILVCVVLISVAAYYILHLVYNAADLGGLGSELPVEKPHQLNR